MNRAPRRTTPRDRIGDPAAAALPAQASNVQAALRKARLDGQVQQLQPSARTAAQAAEALGVGVEAIANSLVFLADDEPVLVLTSGAHQVDTTHLPAQCGAQAIRRANAQQVRAATGQAIGGGAPVGRPVRCAR